MVLVFGFEMHPLILLFLVSLFLSLLNQLVFMLMVDTEQLKTIKEEVKKLKEKSKTLKKSSKEFIEVQEELIEKSLLMSKLSLKPLMVTLLPFWLIFILLNDVMKDTGILIPLPLPLPLLGNGIGWLGTYILFSIIISLVTRKLFEKYAWSMVNKHKKTR